MPNTGTNEINDRHLELMITKTDYQNNRTWTGTEKKLTRKAHWEQNTLTKLGTDFDTIKFWSGKNLYVF